MPFKGGGGIGGPRTRKNKPKHSKVPAPPVPTKAKVRPKPQVAGPTKAESGRSRQEVERDEKKAARRKRRVVRAARKDRATRGRDAFAGKKTTGKAGTIKHKSGVEEFLESVSPSRGGFGGHRKAEEKREKKPARSITPAGAAALGATANLDRATRAVGQGARGAGTFTRNLGRDLVNFPSQAVVSTYHTGKLLKEGKYKEAAEGLVEPYKELARDPARTFYEHPFNTYLLVAGPKGVAGRSAGKAARSGALGKRAKRAASTTGEPKRLPGTRLEEPRDYSPDVITKTGQVAVEKARRSSSRRLVRRADRARKKGEVEKADRLAEKAVRRDPDRVSDKAVARRMDERVDANEILRREDRARVTRDVDKAVPKRASAHVSLTAQGITRASRDDLAAYRRELIAEQESLAGARLAANKRLVRQIDDALKRKGEDVASATRAYKQTVRPLQEKMAAGGMVTRGQAERRTLMPYAVRNMGARHENGRLVARDGSPLSNEQIRAHMRKHGHDPDPVYVTQAPKPRNAYYVAQHEAPNARTGRFTGEATRKGLFDASREALRENAARQQGLVSAQEGFGKIIEEFAATGKSGKVRTFQTRAQAVRRAEELRYLPDGTLDPSVPRMVPVRLNPFAGRQEQLQALLDRVDPENAQEMKPFHDVLKSALDGEDGPGPWTLVPEPAVKRLREHVRLLGPSTGAKTLQAVNSAFRQTVLATSTRWLTGNVVEGLFRAAVAGAGPTSYLRARRVRRRLRQVDPEKAREFDARVTGGGLFTMQTRMPRRGHEQFAGSRLEPMARALHRFWETPGPRQVAGAWRWYTDIVFQHLNKRFENTVQMALAGKAMKHGPLMDKTTLSLSKKAVDQAARGLVNTREQVRLARSVDRMYGRYSKFGPAKKQAVVLYTPFIAWSLNAVEFIYRVLPRDHPALSALIVSMEQASEEWRKEKGLDKFVEGRLPDFLQGSIPLEDGGKQRAPNRYMPFAAVSQGLPQTFADSILPQFSSTLQAARGKDWTGRDKPGDPDDLENAKGAVWAFMESTIPVLALGERVVEEGPREAFDPFVPSKSKGTRDPWSSGWDSGGGWDQGGWDDGGWE